MENNTTNSYKFFIGFGKNIADTKKVVPELTIAQPNKMKVDVDQKTRIDSFNISLDSVQINRKIYQPCEIKVELTFEPSAVTKVFPTPKQLSGMLLQRKVDLGILIDPNAPAKSKNISMIAQNYYVHEIYPQLSRSSVLKVKLSIYSMDKLMTLNKYSKAFTSKKLSDIVKTETTLFGYRDRFLESEINLQNLIYSDNNTKKEFIHPYLVQYNETFYDFLKRITNRCGEFLYFENGKLQVGLKTQDNPIIIGNYANVTFQNESAGPLDIQDYTRDSIKDIKDGKDAMEEKKLNYESILPNKAGYPDDAFATQLSYNSEVAMDDYFFFLYKDKFQTMAHALGVSTKDEIINFILGSVKQALKDTKGGWLGPAEVVKDLAYNISMSIKDAALSNSKSNIGSNEKLIDKYKDKDNGDGTKTVLFSNVLKECWTTVNYFKDIRSKEEEMMRQTICVDMGTNYINVKLGDKIKIDKLDGTYVVIQVKQLSQQKWTNTYNKYDDDSIAQDNYSGQQSQMIYAIPVTFDANNKMHSMPPLAGVSPIRTSGPQTAFVVDNKDNKHQARVRIAFPWQNIASEEKVELAEAARDQKADDILINKMQQEIDAQRKRREKTSALLRFLYKSDSDNKDSLTKIQEELARMKARKTEVEKFLSDEETYKEPEKGATKKKEGDKSSKADLEINLNSSLLEHLTLETKIKNLKAILNPSEEQKAEIKKKETELSALKQKISTTEADIAMIPIKINSYTAEKKELEARIKSMESAYEKMKSEKNKVAEKYNSAIAAASGEEKAKLEKEQAEEWSKVENQTAEELRKEILDAVDEMDKSILKKEEERKEKEKEAAKSADRTKAKADLVNNALTKNASPWVRVATPMATQGGGFYFAPAPGDEVLVNFDNNNVERPYVVGSLYSKNLEDPQSMAIKSPNGHTMSFDNPGDGTKFVESLAPVIGIWKTSLGSTFFDAPEFFGMENASKAYKDATKPMKDFTGGIHFCDRYGFYDVEMCSHKRKVSISSPLGNVSIDAFQGITVSAPNGDVKIEGKNVTIKAGNNLTLQSGGNVRDRAEIAKTAKEFAQSLVTKTVKKAIGNAASVVDLDLLRSVLEVITRPVEGTTLIKSKRYLKLEAGSGKALIQRNRYKLGHQMKHAEDEMFAFMMQKCISSVDSKSEEFFNEYVSLKQKAIESKNYYDYCLLNLVLDAGKNKLPDVKKIAYTYDLTKEWVAKRTSDKVSIKKADFQKEGVYKDGELTISYLGHNARFININRKQNFLHDMALRYGEAIVNLRKHVEMFETNVKNLVNENKDSYHNEYVNLVKSDAKAKLKRETPKATDLMLEQAANLAVGHLGANEYPADYVNTKANTIINEMFTSDNGIIGKWKTKYGKTDPTDDFLKIEVDPSVDPLFADKDHPTNKIVLKRMFAVKLMSEMAKHEKGKKHIALKYLEGKSEDVIKDICKDNKKWNEFVSNMNRSDNAFARGAWDILAGGIKDALSVNFTNMFKWRWKDAEHWDDSMGGQILFSDASGKTIRMEGEQLKVDGDSEKYTESFYMKKIKGLK